MRLTKIKSDYGLPPEEVGDRYMKYLVVIF